MAPGSQLHGADGTLQVIRQLQGYEIPAASWEPEILLAPDRQLRSRVFWTNCANFRAKVMWGRFSPHPAPLLPSTDAEGDGSVRPTRVAPISFFLRDSLSWLAAPSRAHALRLAGGRLCHMRPQDVLESCCGANGALRSSPDLVRGSGRLPSVVEDALWELVAAGLVTADGFENLRALIDPKRRRGQEQGTHPPSAAFRWPLCC